MKQHLLALVAWTFCLVACEKQATTPGAPSATVVPSPGEALPAQPPPSQDGMAEEASGGHTTAKTTPQLPPDWQGTGILEANELSPKMAPSWAKIKAEVVRMEGRHFLRTTGNAAKISNPALAQSTAEARARAHLAYWLGTEHLQNSRIINYWRRSGSKANRHAIAQAEIEIPDGWRPDTQE